MDSWVGKSLSSDKRILILGESWYGPTVCLRKYIQDWCDIKQPDYLFSRIFNTSFYSSKPPLTTASATVLQRQSFWDSVMFDNLVNWSVGTTRSARPTSTDFRKAAGTLSSRLSKLRPTSVWVLGKEQSHYSVPHLGSIKYVVSPHPCGWGVKTSSLNQDWQKL